MAGALDRLSGQEVDIEGKMALETFSVIALALLQAETEDALRKTLNDAARVLAGHSKADIAICEIALSPGGRPAIVWQSMLGGLSVEEGAVFLRWFEKAAVAKAMLAAADGKWHGLLSREMIGLDTGTRIALCVHAKEAGIEHLARAVADAAAAAVSRIRLSKAQALERRHTGEALDRAKAALEIGADIVWEASKDGIIHCRRILNRRNDIANAIDGCNLKMLRIGAGGHSLFDRIDSGGRLRGGRVVPNSALQAVLQPGEILYVSAARHDDISGDKAWTGTFAIVAEEGAREVSRETVAMMAQISGARRREERNRREAEAMLQGLRLLLAKHASGEKIGELVTLVSDCIGGDEACVVQRRIDGKPHYLVPRQRKAGRDDDEALTFISERLADRGTQSLDVSTDDGARLARVFGFSGRHIAILPLPLQAESAFLVCATRRPDGFSAADLDFADRFTLLLRQALLLREEQTQIAQTAKMAALGQMSTSIAHELRQPLNTISLAVQNLEYLISTPDFDSDAAAAKVARILAQVDRASGVIDRMRRFGRKSASDIEQVSLPELIENVEAIMNHVLLRAGVRLEKDLQPGLTVHADRLQLEQVIANLVQNAVDAISGIGAPGTRTESLIRITALPSPDVPEMTIIRVEDSGPGFRPEIIERVLEPFFTTKSAEHGTGLGLAICDTIIRESGGRIDLGNHEGGGYVAITLPG